MRRIVEGVRRGGDRVASAVCGEMGRAWRRNSLCECPRKRWRQRYGRLFRSHANLCFRLRRTFDSFVNGKSLVTGCGRRGGISLGQMVRPLESVGCYVPGGRYPLVSTLLMTVIPAQVAGVRNIRVASPKPSVEVLAAAAMLGVREFYRVGGAQAVAALAYGTSSIPRVDKIVGPGNAYVTVAKKLVSFDCAIDFLAGPTEAVVLSDSGVPEFIAADLVAQAEHDPETLSLLITTSRELARSVRSSAAQLAKGNPIAQKSLQVRGAILDCGVSRTGARVGESSLRRNTSRLLRRIALHSQCGVGVRGRLLGAGSRRLCIRAEPRVADFGAGAISWRPKRGGFCEGDYRAATFCQRVDAGSRRQSNVSPGRRDCRRMRNRSE